MSNPLKKVIAAYADGTAYVFGDGAIPITTAMETAIAAAIPPPVPPPAFTTILVSPSGSNRTNGIGVDGQVPFPKVGSSYAINSTSVDSYTGNVVGIGITDYQVKKLVSVNAWRNTVGDTFKGMGFYVDKCGIGKISEMLSAYNGWQSGKPPEEKNTYRHGLYHNLEAGPIVVEDSIFAYNCCCNVQTRNTATFRRCCFIKGAISAYAIKGGATFEDCVWIDGGYYYNPPANGKPATWSGNMAVSATDHVAMTRCAVVGQPGQDIPLTPLKAYALGALNGSKDWGGAASHGVTVPGASWTLSGVVMKGWPGPSFSGDRPPSGTGVTVNPGAASIVMWEPIVKQAIKSGKIAEASAAIRELAWKAAA